MGRWRLPGERSTRRWGLQDEQQGHNRVYVGQVVDVDETNGVLTVVTTGAGQHRVVVPVGGLTVDGRRSAWMRYMPGKYDHVLLGFGPDKQPFCLGAAAWGHDETVVAGNRLAGYGRLATAAARDDAPAGLREFVPLRSGEWDMRSSGGAYVHGSRLGVLTLSGGGSTKVVLDKDRDEAVVGTAMFEYADGGVKLRVGSVKRPALGQAKDQTPVGATKAYELDVGTATVVGGAVVTTPLYKARYGNVWTDGIGALPATGPVGTTVVHEAAYGAGGAVVWEHKVDSTGNSSVVASTGAWTASMNSIELNATTTLGLYGAGGVTLAASASAGATAQPVVHGTSLNTLLNEIILYLTTHTHPSPQAPSGTLETLVSVRPPPMIPADLLSTIVRAT